MDSAQEMELRVISVVTELTFIVSSTDWDSEFLSLFTQLCYNFEAYDGIEFFALINKIHFRKPTMLFLAFTDYIRTLKFPGKLNRRWKIVLSIISQIMFLVSSMDLGSESSELVSLIKQVMSLFKSKPDSESELVSLITQIMRLGISSVDLDLNLNLEGEATQESYLPSLIGQLVSLKPEPELTSLIEKIISRFRSFNWEPMQFLSFCPQDEVVLFQGKFHVDRQSEKKHRKCDLKFIQFWRSKSKYYFYCKGCRGENHEEYEKAPVEVKHPLHPKHSLRLVLFDNERLGTRKCYCCDGDLIYLFYYCSACDFAMNLGCVDKTPRILSVDLPKWHEHPLALFPTQVSFPCSLCALTHSTSCPFYACSPCDFVVHQSCLSLPRVLRISRHPHRLIFTPSFDKGITLCCGICRRKIDNDYGSYSCVEDCCPYAAHSACATQRNVWDGEDLEGVPEDIEEELEPFVRISDGIIQHFSHQQHHLRLDEDTDRDYDENKLCQACVTPIYFGNCYSCMECDFILHEECANLSRKIFHPIHPHLLTLVTTDDGVISYKGSRCRLCPRLITGFFYECNNEECFAFTLHVQCSTVSEPLARETHMYPLFLTSKPGECRTCSVCEGIYRVETFNCIEECDFALCFGCATIPQKVRYKHDKHILSLSYGEETSIMKYWCEACEREIEPKGGFYKCDEYCSVTIHIKCLIGEDFYMKPGLLFEFYIHEMRVLPNNHHMSRPFCSQCKKRCPQNNVFQGIGFILCSTSCVYQYYRRKG